MKLWLWIVITLMFQELVSTNVVLLDAFQQHYNVWIIHAVFLATTTIGIVVGYWLGLLVQRKFKGSRPVLYAQARAKKFSSFMGKTGTRLSLIFLSIVDVNFMDSFIAAWLVDVPFWEIFLYLFIGNLVWYAAQWGIILTVNAYVHSLYWAFAVVIGISLALTIVSRLVSRRELR